jgi:ribosomal protein S12 methylthiotransferase accessory factor
MASHDRRYWIVFNGEIYNFEELRQDLVADGAVFTSATDTEVLLELWARRGPECLSSLRGMFAFALFDSGSQTLWVARDRLGIKPVYVACWADGVAVASELRGVHASGQVPRRWNTDAVRAFLAAGVNKPDDEDTFFEGVREVPAGCLLEIRPHALRTHRYYSLPPVGAMTIADGDLGLLRERFTETVALHLRSLREVGACVSGGLDSSNIACAVARLRGAASGDFRAFTFGSAGSLDVEFARLTARTLGLRHFEVAAPAHSALDDLVDMVRACETPNHTWGPLNQYLLLRAIAHEHRLCVLLDGQGGDEVLSAYPWFVPPVAAFVSARFGAAQGRLLTSAYEAREALPRKVLATVQSLYNSSTAWVQGFEGGALQALGMTLDEALALPAARYFLNDALSWNEMRARQLLRRELAHFLRHEDRLGMWFSIECRVPFVDHTLVELLGDCDPRFLFRDGYAKYPLRHLFAELPERLRLETRKSGYWENHSAAPDLVAHVPALLESCAILRALVKRPDRLELTPFAAWRFFQIAVLSEDWDAGVLREPVPLKGRTDTALRTTPRDMTTVEPASASAEQAPDAAVLLRGQRLSARKRFVDGTHRVMAPAETLERIRPHFPAVGLTRLADVTGLDRVGISTSIAYRPNSPTLSNSSGKGFSRTAALVSGAMEAIELYHGENLRLPVRRTTYAELERAGDAIPRQRLHLTKGSLFNPQHPEVWVPGWDLVQQREVWAPFAQVGMVTHAQQRPQLWMPFPMNSNGLASGNVLIEAICAGLFEVLERDALACHMMAHRHADHVYPRVAQETIKFPRVLALLERLRDARLGVLLDDLTVDTGVPVFMATVYDTTNRHVGMYGGYGAHLDPEVAMIRALTEAVQSRLIYIAGSRDDYFRHDYLKHHMRDSEDEVAGLESQKAQVDVSGLQAGSNPTFEQDLTDVLARLRGIGLDQVLVFDLTHEELGISVVRVIVPGLEACSLLQSYARGPRARAFAESVRDRQNRAAASRLETQGARP